MDGTDLRAARRAAIRNTQQAVRIFAREPNADTERTVAQACTRWRMLDEWRVRRAGALPLA
ncbi:MAG: hypothetical protein GVY33_08805 [Alphaproteobacteria bacterium]|jgi:hypothetical protein|nr:hypothetical protein [Alphaproteobacteria bacterium]